MKKEKKNCIEAGGQAVIEGVMIKSHDKMAISVRLANGSIRTKKGNLKKNRAAKIPFLRGIAMLVDTLYQGMKAITWSANQQLKKEEEIKTNEIIYTIIFSVVFAALIFMVVPFFLAGLFAEQGFLFNFIDGIFRILLFFLYIAAISMIKDVKRLFKYHGAEHKAINCYESGLELNVKNCRRFSTLNPRCGTSFILIVLVISIIVFTVLSSEYWLVNVLERVFFIPVIASVSYEILKISARYRKNPFMKLIIYPGLLMQKLTTREPSDKQIEVAIRALKSVVE